MKKERTPLQQQEQLQRQSRWYDLNKAHHNAMVRLRYRRLRNEVLSAYGWSCACCGEDVQEFLCLDHVNGGGTKERREKSSREVFAAAKRDGFPRGRYRVLCCNCNFSIGAFGYCPHQRPLASVI